VFERFPPLADAPADAAVSDAVAVDDASPADATLADAGAAFDAPSIVDAPTSKNDAPSDGTLGGDGDAGDSGDSSDGGDSGDGGDGGDSGDSGCGACDAACILGYCAVSLPRMPDSKDEAPSDGTGSVPCPPPGAPGYGQDCSYRLNVPSFVTDVDIAVDTVTGLVWERQSSGQFTVDQTVQHCQSLATSSFAGFGDWRVPTAREAITIVNTGKNDQGLDQTVFVSQNNAWLWTSTRWAGDGVSFARLAGDYPNLEEALGTQSGPGSRCVRGGPLPDGALSVGASGDTVDDPRTGLTWQRAVPAGGYVWLDALAYCDALVLDGASDWRLPNYKELWSIVDVTQLQPAVDPQAFPATPLENFWSSSPVGNMRTRAYAVDFANGLPRYSGGPPMTTTNGVRCVRGGS
jgi:hypothetical protein